MGNKISRPGSFKPKNFKKFPELPTELKIRIFNMAFDNATYYDPQSFDAQSFDHRLNGMLANSVLAYLVGLPELDLSDPNRSKWPQRVRELILWVGPLNQLASNKGEIVYIERHLNNLTIMASCRFARQIGLEWFKRKVEERWPEMSSQIKRFTDMGTGQQREVIPLTVESAKRRLIKSVKDLIEMVRRNSR